MKKLAKIVAVLAMTSAGTAYAAAPVAVSGAVTSACCALAICCGMPCCM